MSIGDNPKDMFKLYGFSIILTLLSAILWVLFLFFIGVV
jgi:hypothetical protein